VDEADLVVVNGSFLIPSVGQEFIDVAAKIRTTSANHLAVEDFRAAALSGQVAGSATVALAGLALVARDRGAQDRRAEQDQTDGGGGATRDVWGTITADVPSSPNATTCNCPCPGSTWS